MSWRERTLAECAKFLSGGTPKKALAEYWSGDIPWVGSGEMSESFLRDTTLHVTREGAENGSRLVPENTILVVVRGMSLAKEFRISLTMREMTFNQDVKALFCTEGIRPRFLFYSLKSKKEMIKGLATDASHGTKKLETDQLKAVVIRVPDTLAEQDRVVSVLSAYDDLIENNRRRIALLEQAARLLYREWFVHFRFPGHETTKFVDGLPAGWKILTVEKSVERFPPGKLFSQQTASEKGSIPILDQGKSGQLGFHDEQPSFNASLDDPVIVFANHTCYQRIIHFPFSAIQNVLPFKPSANVPNELYWLHHATIGLVKLNAYKGHWPEFKIKELPVPTPNVAADFASLVRPMHLQMHKLESLNNQLIRARDLLLPRLMDGRIPV